MKACAVHVDGVWKDVYKDPTEYDAVTWEPIRSSFKKSKAGRMELMYNADLDDYKTVRVEEVADHVAHGYEPQLELVYDAGKLIRDMTFAEVRANAKLPAERIRIEAAEVEAV